MLPIFNLIVALTSYPRSLPVSSKSILSRRSSSWRMRISHTSSTSRSARAKSLHPSSQFWITTLKSGSRRYSTTVSHIEQLPEERMESLRASRQSARLCVRPESSQFLQSFRNLRSGTLPGRRLLAHAQPAKELPVKPQRSLPSHQDGLAHPHRRQTQLLLALIRRACSL
jgi:hypothetical protein